MNNANYCHMGKIGLHDALRDSLGRHKNYIHFIHNYEREEAYFCSDNGNCMGTSWFPWFGHSGISHLLGD